MIRILNIYHLLCHNNYILSPKVQVCKRNTNTLTTCVCHRFETWFGPVYVPRGLCPMTIYTVYRWQHVLSCILFSTREGKATPVTRMRTRQPKHRMTATPQWTPFVFKPTNITKQWGVSLATVRKVIFDDWFLLSIFYIVICSRQARRWGVTMCMATNAMPLYKH